VTSDINNELNEKARHFIDEPLELHLNYMYSHVQRSQRPPSRPKNTAWCYIKSLFRGHVIKVQNGTSKWSLFKGGRYLTFGCTYLLKYYLYFSLGRIEWRESGWLEASHDGHVGRGHEEEDPRQLNFFPDGTIIKAVFFCLIQQ